MSQGRRKHSPAFKAKVALEGQDTVPHFPGAIDKSGTPQQIVAVRVHSFACPQYLLGRLTVPPPIRWGGTALLSPNSHEMQPLSLRSRWSKSPASTVSAAATASAPTSLQADLSVRPAARSLQELCASQDSGRALDQYRP